MPRNVDLIKHPPTAAQPGAVDPGKFIAKRLTDTARVCK